LAGARVAAVRGLLGAGRAARLLLAAACAPCAPWAGVVDAASGAAPARNQQAQNPTQQDMEQNALRHLRSSCAQQRKSAPRSRALRSKAGEPSTSQIEERIRNRKLNAHIGSFFDALRASSPVAGWRCAHQASTS